MENVMLQDEKKEWIKIIDFGLSNIYSEENPLKTLCGSPEYAAPELFVKGKKYGPEVDLWSLGVILFVMGTGRLPFTSPRDESTSADERRRRLMAQINRGLSAPQERLIVTLSAEYKNLLRFALAPAAHERIRLDELRRHPWIDASASANFAAETLQLCLAERQAIVREISARVSVDYREVEVDIVGRRFGNLGGMYNIISHKMQSRKLEHSSGVKSLRTPQILKHNFEKLSHESPKKIKISGTIPIVKHDYSSDQKIKEAKTTFMQYRMFRKDSRRIDGNPKPESDKTKKKGAPTAIQSSSPKQATHSATHSIPVRVRNNKEIVMQKQRKATKDPTKVKFCQFQIKTKVNQTTADVGQRNTCSAKKYSTSRLANNTTTKKSSTSSEPDRTVSKSHDKVKRLFKKVSAEK